MTTASKLQQKNQSLKDKLDRCTRINKSYIDQLDEIKRESVIRKVTLNDLISYINTYINENKDKIGEDDYKKIRHKLKVARHV